MLTTAATLLPAKPSYAVTDLAIDELAPFAPGTAGDDRLLLAMVDTRHCQAIVEKLWFAYKRTGKFEYAEWAANYTYVWWRTYPFGDPGRIRSAMAGRRMSTLLRNEKPNHPAGKFWSSLFIGAESISRGLLNAVHLIPESEQMMLNVFREAPTYMFGLPGLMLAKLYTKAPPFPVSVGNLDRAGSFFEASEKLDTTLLPVYYLFKAEYLHLLGQTDAALALLKSLDSPPANDMMGFRYAHETSRFDAARFRDAVHNGTYNKLTWDPLLEIAQFPPAPTL